MSTWIRPFTTAAAAAVLLSALTACGDGSQVAADPGTSAPTAPTTSTGSGTPGSYPTFAPTDYTYRLQVFCYCPLLGPIDVTVKNGVVTDAVVARGQHRGDQAPEPVRKTINDIIALANSTKGDVKVDWPQGADAPHSVQLNPIRRASDAAVTYVISDVSAG